ncbi:MAG: D-alanine--D-alanine ligase family protein [Planctomycetota bacterium]
MKTLRILILVRKGLEPPDSIEGMSDDEIQGAPWKTEFDVLATLEELGHKVRVLPVFSDLDVIREGVEAWKPHIAFNLLEEFRGIALYDQNVVSHLELLGVPYTGCNPRGLMIARDKALSKKLLAFHRIRVPDFAVYARGRRNTRTRKLDKYPLLVKSAVEDASLGISQASLVKEEGGLKERVTFIHDHTGTDAIAEEFIEGRELYVGILGNRRLEVFPIWEFLFKNKPDSMPLIATARAKWSVKYQKKYGVDTRAAKDLPEPLVRKIVHHCRRIYRILGLTGYARLDFRLREDGTLFFLEANPNPNLAFGEDFAESAEKKGLAYNRLIQRILNLGRRWKPVKLV